MAVKQLIKSSAYFSFAIQIIVGLITISGLFLKLKQQDKSLHEVLLMDTVVQFIEAAFYVWLIYSFSTLNNRIITSRRYIDWVITTPIMLITTVIYMKYNTYKKDGDIDNLKKLSLNSFMKENTQDIIKLVGYNFLMLAFGFLGETRRLPLYISTTIGFIFFTLNFNLIYTKYAANTTSINMNLFNFLLVVWGLYGVAAVMPLVSKNVMYNLLDIVSKNFYGLYIYYQIVLLQK